MDFIEQLGGLGLPGWVIILAALLWILNTVGLLDPVKNILGAINADRAAARAFARDRQRDHEEAVQGRQVQALNQVININETLINTLITVIDSQINLLREIRGTQISHQGKMEIVVREWSRIEEVLSDIDLYMHETKQEQAAQALALEKLARIIDRKDLNRQDKGSN